ncbi:C-C motif chemokine 4 homolog [Nerophis ophidion]|uniref:C-C motif chemokine 4 homolog n=1 Tax=Nerophis ophidion TaxID=159077 RepID=UPI002AE060B1|nr:C-C motif chemokine 4 homolog [Nerophis ophidion]
MRGMTVFALCVLASAVILSARCNNSSGPDHCCFKHYPVKVPQRFIKSYALTDSRCPVIGVILVTKKNLHICANPKDFWVERIMKHLDESTM